jgi:hypothetical protein
MKLLLALTISALLTACGGGGGGGSSSSTPVTNVSGAGVWNGYTYPSGNPIDLIVMPNNTMYSLFGTAVNGGTILIGADFGSVTSSGSSFSGSFTEYFYNNTSITGTTSGTIVANTSLSGTSKFSNGNTANYALTPITSGGYNFNTPAVLSTITGSWVGSLLTGIAATLTINANGTLSGFSAGCSFTGTIAPDPSGVNVFATVITYGSGCTKVGLVETGISLSYLFPSGGTRQLIVMVSSPTTGGAFVAQR